MTEEKVSYNPEALNRLWRAVVAVFLSDYLTGDQQAERDMDNGVLENICHNAGFDPDCVRETAIKAKKDFQESRKKLQHWRSDRRKQTTPEKEILDEGDSGMAFIDYFRHDRLKKVAPDIADYLSRNWNIHKQMKVDKKKRRRHNCDIATKDKKERKKAEDFFKELWS